MPGSSYRRDVVGTTRSYGTLSTLVRSFARPKLAAVSLLWLFGLFAVFLAPAPVKITPEKLEAYKLKVREAEGLIRQLARAEQTLMDAQLRLDEVKVWFYWWRPEHRKLVEARRPAVKAAQQRVRALQKEREGILREGKAALGLWSDAGLEESRQLLWTSFDTGKVFAQRQTFWDSIFAVFDSRDKDWFTLLIQLLFTAVINYTIGGVMSVITFIVTLPSFLASFAPTWPSAIAFFTVAALGAVSLVATYVAALFAAGTAVAVTTATFVGNYGGARQRIGNGRAQWRPIGNDRTHYD